MDGMETIKVSNGEIAVLRIENYPDRPTIIFLHDSPGCIQLWRDFPKKPGQITECNVLVYDRLGYGYSAPMPTHKRPVNYLENEAGILNELLQAIDKVAGFLQQLRN